MAEVTLLRTRKVLWRSPPPRGEVVRFTRAPDEPGDVPAELELPRQDWRDMGHPEAVTVTVEPGDRLNAPAGA